MKKRPALNFALALFPVQAMAQVVDMRRVNQVQRIDQGVSSGSLRRRNRRQAIFPSMWKLRRLLRLSFKIPFFEYNAAKAASR